MTDDGHDTVDLRRKLVAGLREQGALRSDAVAAAFEAVPREAFLPGRPLDEVYQDRAYPTHWRDGMPISSSSQPGVMAPMLDLLDVQPGDRVLEIGAGTGYNAALLATLAGESGAVTTVDIEPDVAEGARTHLLAAGCGSVRVVEGDGALGVPDAAPFDRVIVTAGCWQIPPAWLEQLRDGGVLVLPLRINGSSAIFALRRDQKRLVSVGACAGGFMQLRGAFNAASPRRLPDGWEASSDGVIDDATAQAAAHLLEEEQRPSDIDVPDDPMERWNASLFISLQGAPQLLVRRLIVADEGGTRIDERQLTLVSPSSAVIVTQNALSAAGTADAEEFVRAQLARFRAAGSPGSEALSLLVEPLEGDVEGPLPAPVEGARYVFARGKHRYALTYAS